MKWWPILRTVWISERSSHFFTQLKQLRKESLKKIQARTGFEPMTSAIPVQRSTNWAIKPTGSWSLCEFVIYPLRWWDESKYKRSDGCHFEYSTTSTIPCKCVTLHIVTMRNLTLVREALNNKINYKITLLSFTEAYVQEVWCTFRFICVGSVRHPKWKKCQTVKTI